MTAQADGCGAPTGGASFAGVDLDKEAVITGVVSRDAQPVGGAYVRLLDGTGEFTAEVVTSASGDFRFFAAPGTWTLSVMHKDGKARTEVRADGPGLHKAALELS